MAQENISAQLNDLLSSRDFQAELLDKEGRPTDAENADIFTFDYVSSSGKNYGTMVIILDTDNEMQVFYGDNLGRSMEGDDKTEFFDFVQHLHKFANMRRWTYSPKNINQVKYTMQGLAAIKEGLFEGYYGTRKVSYSGEPTEARLVIQHNRTLGEADARFRYVESLFIETADSERYRLQFKNLAGGRAMLEHVRQGGKPYDVRGSHITEMVSEIATLSRFNRASAGRVLEGVTAELVTEAQQYYKSLRENLKRMAGTRGYQAYFESWHPAETTLQEELVDSIKTMFVEQTLDSRIEAALPVLARLQQENRMKEADIFESWADNLTEGTWALPDTPEKHKRLQDLMSRPLIVGPDATNATEQLDDLVGDDRLFDYLEDLADRDASANVWDDTDVQLRLGDLGIQLPGQPPEDDEDDADVDATADADQQPPVQESRVKELSMDLEDPLMSDEEFETKYGDSRANMQGRAGRVQDRKTGRFYDPEQEFDRLKNSPEFQSQMKRMSEGDVFRRHGKNRNPTIPELEMWIKNWTSFQIGGNLTDAGRAKVGQSIAKAQRLLAKKKQQQGVAEAALKGTAKEYAAKAQAAEAKYLKYEDLVDQELQKLGQRLPQSWDAGRMNTKLSSHPKYALALKYYTLSEKFASQAIRYEQLARKQGMAEGSDIGYHQTSGTKAGYTVSSRKLSNKPQASKSDVTLQSGSMHHRGKSYNFPKGTLFTQLPGGIFAKHPDVPETAPGYGHVIRKNEDNINKIHAALSGVAEGRATYGPVTDTHKAAAKKAFAAGERDGKAGAEKNKQYMSSALMKTTYLNGYKQGKQGVAEGTVYDLEKEYGYEKPVSKPRRSTPSDYPYGPEEDDAYFREIFRKKREAAKKAEQDKGQVNELDKKTLGSYVKKATDSMDTHAYHAYRHQDDSDYDKKEKRKQGIGKAVDRLTKEQDVAEGSEEQVYKVVALDKSNALKKPKKLNVKASSVKDVFNRLAASDWYALSINGVEVINGKRLKQGVAEGVEIVDQDSDLDQQVFTLNVDGKTVSFTYWDYENNFQNPDIKDIYQQAREQLGKKLSPEQIKAVARSVFKSFKSDVAEGLPQTLRKIVPGYAKREIDRKMDAQKFGRTDVDKDANYWRYKKIQDKIKEQGMAEGDDPWGDQGRFAGDTRVDIGGTTLNKIESGDTVSYFGEKARVVDLDYTNDHARIAANGKTLNVKLSDLKRVGGGVVENLLAEYETGLDGDQVLEDNLPEAKMSPQQQNDFDRMRYGAMGRKEYDAKWKKPQKSDDQVIYGKKPSVAEAGTCNHTMEGEMCPEHGLAECGMHESQVQESQQHLADLARLKSLAHGK